MCCTRTDLGPMRYPTQRIVAFESYMIATILCMGYLMGPRKPGQDVQQEHTPEVHPSLEHRHLGQLFEGSVASSSSTRRTL